MDLQRPAGERTAALSPHDPRIDGSVPSIRGLPAHEKTLAIRRGFWLVLGLAFLALIPPSSLPPGAGNAYKYARNTDLYEAKETEEG